MTPALEAIAQHDLAEFCQRWGIREMALFGSVLNDSFTEESDVDVLVSFTNDARIGLWELAAIQQELETLFGRKVDLVEKEGLKNPIRRRSILNSCETVYASE